MAKVVCFGPTDFYGYLDNHIALVSLISDRAILLVITAQNVQ